jgi:hypothetical protein
LLEALVAAAVDALDEPSELLDRPAGLTTPLLTANNS